jgi:hypothetical protein
MASGGPWANVLGAIDPPLPKGKSLSAAMNQLGPVINYAIHGVIDGRTGKTSLARPSFKAQQAAEPLVTP